MNTSKIIIGKVSVLGKYSITNPIFKEDYGLYLQIEGIELPPTYEVDFSNSENSGTSVTMIGNSDGVLIPRQFIDSGKDVFAFLYHVGSDFGRTVYKFRIPNKVRPDRTNEEPTPEEQSTIDQAISALNEAVAQTAQDVIDAAASAQSAQGYAEQAESARDTAQTYANNAQTSATQASTSASQASASATASANSASQAQGYAQSASASAQSASGYASSAQTSAQTASSKATEASTSASTATQKATESAQSASLALSYKTDAESAKTASQTAQGLAESARDSAIQAKTDAESARDDAESARDEAQSAVASISGALAEKAPVITDTASGAIASFSDGADDLPLKSLIVDINPIQDLSQGDPSPTNICPISGWTSVDVEQSGVNVWDGYVEDGALRESNGEEYPAALDKRSGWISVSGGASYYFRRINSTIGTGRFFFYDANKQFLSSIFHVRNNSFTTPSNASYMRFWFTNLALVENDISINYPSTDHDYHPYTGRSITIPLGQTVYGAKLYPLEGKALITHGYLQKNTADMNNSENYPGWGNSGVRDIVGTDIGGIIRNTISNIGRYVSANTRGPNDIVYLPISYYSKTQSEWQALALDVQFVIPLAEPLEIQLSANQINSLYGVNNIWADSGDTEAEYRADTKLYIERLTAPDSADMIADANITSGQYFMVGNSLYKATANIANGSAIIVGTNCIRKSLSEALNEINA